MASDEAAHLLNEIGAVLAEDLDYPLDGTLLYAEVWPDAVSSAVFKNGGDHVAYQDGPGPLVSVLLDLWAQASPAKSWAEMEYVVRGCGGTGSTLRHPSLTRVLALAKVLI